MSLDRIFAANGFAEGFAGANALLQVTVRHVHPNLKLFHNKRQSIFDPLYRVQRISRNNPKDVSSETLALGSNSKKFCDNLHRL